MVFPNAICPLVTLWVKLQQEASLVYNFNVQKATSMVPIVTYTYTAVYACKRVNGEFKRMLEMKMKYIQQNDISGMTASIYMT